ncbi:unnamed protein product, partial [Symbiodinium sp. KB8]
GVFEIGASPSETRYQKARSDARQAEAAALEAGHDVRPGTSDRWSGEGASQHTPRPRAVRQRRTQYRQELEAAQGTADEGFSASEYFGDSQGR